MQVMQYRNDRHTVPVEALRQTQDLQLVVEVKIRRWLIKEQNIRRLGERHRDPHALTLSTRQFADSTPHQVRDTRILHRASHRLVVLITPLMENRLIGIAAASNQILDKHVARSDRRLSKQTQSTRKSLLIHISNASPIQLDHTASHAKHSG